MYISIPILLVLYYIYSLCDEDKYQPDFPEEYCGDGSL